MGREVFHKNIWEIRYQSVLVVSLVQLLEGKEGLVSESPQEFEKILSLFVEYDENNRKYPSSLLPTPSSPTLINPC